MGRHVALLFILAFAASYTLVPLPVKAEPRAIVVPDNYATIQAAINAANEGDSIFVKKGIYEGAQNQTLLINRTISLIGEGALSTVFYLHPPLVPMNIFTLEYMGYLDAVKIDTNGVKISGLTIISDGGGLSAVGNETQINNNNLNFRTSITGYGTRIESNTLTGIVLKGSNQTIAKNTILNGTAEFLISCVGSYNTIMSNRIAGTGGGIYTNGSHNIVHGNSVAAESAINAGLELNGNENIVYRNNISNFVCIGSTFVPESSSNIICGNTISNYLVIVGNDNTFNANYFQGIVLGNRIQDASNNVFYYNNFDFAKKETWFSGDKTFTVWEGVQGPVFLDNGKEGNYYSDYNGSDLNSDGIGDTPYVIITKDPNNFHNIAAFNIADMVLTDNYPLVSPCEISSVTMELPEWQYVSQLPSPATTPSPPARETAPPMIKLLLSANQTYNESSISFVFTVDKSLSWASYSLDRKENVTVIGNFTLTNLPNGLHSLTVYANDTYGNMGASETVSFTVAVPGPSPVVPVAIAVSVVAVAITVAVVSAGLLLYRRRRSRMGRDSSAFGQERAHSGWFSEKDISL